MGKIDIVYFSNTGNTEAMAEILADSVRAEGLEVDLVPASEAKADKMLESDIIVMGCCACGTEELDTDYIEPLMEAFENKLEGKKLALFGSYGWGGGEFMETWVERIQDSGGELIGHVVGEEGPGDVEDELKDLGKEIARLAG